MAAQFETLDDAINALTAPGQFFAVTEREIGGVSYRVFENLPPNLRVVFERCKDYGDAEFIVYQDERLSFQDTFERVVRVAAKLHGDFGIKKGDRVALAMRNYPEWIFTYMAVISIGGVVVPLNAWWGTEELEFSLQDCGAKFVVCDWQRLQRLLPLVGSLDLTLICARPEGLLPPGIIDYATLLAGTDAPTLPDVEIGQEDDATILYTSGSTGHPKGAVSTHRAVLSVLLNWYLIGESMRQSGRVPETPPNPPRTLLTVPLFHVTGCNSHFLLSLLGGRTIVMMYKWDVNEAMQLIQDERITHFLGVPTMSYELLNAPNRSDYDLSTLGELSAGGAARPKEHVGELAEGFKGVNPSVGYGLTETNAIGAVNGGEDYVLRPGSTGRPTAPMVEMRIVDDNGQECPRGEPGEILIKSACNIRGYWNRPEETAAAFTDGWLHTGDIGYLDEDEYLYIVDRKKDIIIRGGENISCLEVEAVLFSHPAVAEVVVFGLPDERLGEIVATVVSLQPDAEATAEDLQAFAREHLAAFKVPTHVVITQESLPRIASGKLNKRAVRAAILEELNA